MTPLRFESFVCGGLCGNGLHTGRTKAIVQSVDALITNEVGDWLYHKLRSTAGSRVAEHLANETGGGQVQR